MFCWAEAKAAHPKQIAGPCRPPIRNNCSAQSVVSLEMPDLVDDRRVDSARAARNKVAYSGGSASRLCRIRRDLLDPPNYKVRQEVRSVCAAARSLTKGLIFNSAMILLGDPLAESQELGPHCVLSDALRGSELAVSNRFEEAPSMSPPGNKSTSTV